MDIVAIQKILPHRYPFLLVDKILEVEEGKKALGLKNVTVNEPFFQGHFPGYPVMPGVLLVEAMAQVGAVAILSQPEYQGKLALFAGIDKLRFRKQVFPGDQLLIEVVMLKIKAGIGKAEGKVTCDGKLVCSGEIMFAIGGDQA